MKCFETETRIVHAIFYPFKKNCFNVRSFPYVRTDVCTRSVLTLMVIDGTRTEQTGAPNDVKSFI